LNRHILLTGGAGFIGSHTYVALIEAGYRVTILDNFENARPDVADRLERITGAPVSVLKVDVRDAGAMKTALDSDFDAVVHFAALKSVPDGEAYPTSYYRSNCAGLMNTAEAMQQAGVRRIVFSSSAAVYGNASEMPITEQTAVVPENTYARTKAFGEEYLQAIAHAHPDFRIGLLRYFNPVGAHHSGLIGEDPSQPPGNLVPVIARVATGVMPQLKIFGDDYPTPDGTGIRDYIHVEDLARGHVLSLDALFEREENHLVNLGTGQGYSVREVIATYKRVSNRDIPFEIAPRRAGDPAISYADVTRARDLLGFEAQHDLRSMCTSNWAFAAQAKALS
jgi:UDP-glucose 4-epimerase